MAKELPLLQCHSRICRHLSLNIITRCTRLNQTVHCASHQVHLVHQVTRKTTPLFILTDKERQHFKYSHIMNKKIVCKYTTKRRDYKTAPPFFVVSSPNNVGFSRMFIIFSPTPIPAGRFLRYKTVFHSSLLYI